MQAQPQPDHRKNLAILAFSLVVVMLGFGMVVPVFPFLIERMGVGGGALGLLVAVAALTEFLFGPIWGSVSDRIGRKPVLMVGMLGYGLSLVLFGLSTELWMLFASRALSGVLSSAALTTAMAYIGDSTPEKTRGGGMGALGGAAGLGVILGPGLGGWLAGDSLSLPFFIGAGLALAALTLVALLLPESLRPEARLAGRVEFGRARWRALRRAAAGPIGPLLLTAFLATLGTSNFESIFSLYAVDRLAYGPERVGAILTVLGLVAVVGRGGLTGLVTRRWGEAAVVKASLLAGSAAFVLLLLAGSYAAVLATTALFMVATTCLRPSIHSLTSQRATGGQGATLGLSNSFVSLGRVAGPIVAGVAYDINPAVPYLSGAVILFAVFLLSLRWVVPAEGARSASAVP
jgi:DHA1 family multidrug resistance protein-like MFS transporter